MVPSGNLQLHVCESILDALMTHGGPREAEWKATKLAKVENSEVRTTR